MVNRISKESRLDTSTVFGKRLSACSSSAQMCLSSLSNGTRSWSAVKSATRLLDMDGSWTDCWCRFSVVTLHQSRSAHKIRLLGTQTLRIQKVVETVVFQSYISLDRRSRADWLLIFFSDSAWNMERKDVRSTRAESCSFPAQSDSGRLQTSRLSERLSYRRHPLPRRSWLSSKCIVCNLCLSHFLYFQYKLPSSWTLSSRQMKIKKKDYHERILQSNKMEIKLINKIKYKDQTGMRTKTKIKILEKSLLNMHRWSHTDVDVFLRLTAILTLRNQLRTLPQIRASHICIHTIKFVFHMIMSQNVRILDIHPSTEELPTGRIYFSCYFQIDCLFFIFDWQISSLILINTDHISELSKICVSLFWKLFIDSITIYRYTFKYIWYIFRKYVFQSVFYWNSPVSRFEDIKT